VSVAAQDRIVPSLELIRRTVAIENAYTLSRLRILEAIKGNPVGVFHRKVGRGGQALMARHLPVASFNRIAGLAEGDESELEAVLGWYRDERVAVQVELVPGFEGPALTRELARLGFHHSGFQASMIARPRLHEPNRSLTIEPVVGDEAMDEFTAAYAAGWGIPDRAQFLRNVRPWPTLPGWSLFLARIDGVPAAAAILFIQGDMAYLADAATDPKFRGHGCQTALLRSRLHIAADTGAEFAVSGAAFLSGSHRNMARAGMELQFVRAIWTAVDRP